MPGFRFACSKLQALLSLIGDLLTLDFPYQDSQEALELIKQLLGDAKSELGLYETASPATIQRISAITLHLIRLYIPLLGFIVRSTDVRNAFEIFRPLRSLAGCILEPNRNEKERAVRIVLSSEWRYSPHVYKSIPALPDFALIGLPAPESGNPLLIPLAGHELGHLVWLKYGLASGFKKAIYDESFRILSDERPGWFGTRPKSEHDLRENIFASTVVERAAIWAIRQCEESFSDFTGLRIFGFSYLQAFAYLLSPCSLGSRSIFYPERMQRVQNLIKAARFYDVSIDQGYESMFVEPWKLGFSESVSEDAMAVSETYALQLAERTHDFLIPRLIQKAGEIIETAAQGPNTMVTNSPEEQNRIFQKFRMVVPPEKCSSLPDILNAAWKAYMDDSFWTKEDIPDVGEREKVLKELILKTLEIFEFERILERPA